MNLSGRLQRSGYTLLELLIALGLLGTLLAVAWSLLGTYRMAEERGWRQGERLQKVRLARLWLQSDATQMCESVAMELADVGVDAGNTSVGATPSRDFRGDARGFSIDVLGSIDPLPWLHELMRGSQPLARTVDDSMTGDFLEIENISEGGVGHRSALGRDQRTVVTIEYRLIASGGGTGDVATFQLRRRLTPRNFWKTSTGVQETNERLLTSRDLYRTDDEPVIEDAAAANEREEGVLQGLEGARFRYSDGEEWKSSWDTRIENGLPTAIELVFDFPATSQSINRNLSDDRLQSEEEALFGGAEEFESESAEAALGMGELTGEDLTSGGETRPSDVRIVVVPMGSRGNGNRSNRIGKASDRPSMTPLEDFGGAP